MRLYYTIIPSFLLLFTSCDKTPGNNSPDIVIPDNGIYIEGELYQTVDSVRFFSSKDSHRHFCLYTKTDSSHYQCWGTIQLTSPNSASSYKELLQIDVLLKNGELLSITKKENSDDYSSILVKTCQIKLFDYSEKDLLIFSTITMNDGQIIDIVYSGPISRMYVY